MPTIGWLHSTTNRGGEWAMRTPFYAGIVKGGWPKNSIDLIFLSAEGAYGSFNKALEDQTGQLIHRGGKAVDVIISTGGVVTLRAAISKVTRSINDTDYVELPVLYMIGQNDPCTSAPTVAGGVNLNTASDNERRKISLINRFGVTTNSCCLLFNSNSATGSVESTSWSGGPGMVLDASGGNSNDKITDWDDVFDTIKNDLAATSVVVAADPFFTSQRSKLVQAANKSHLYICYPFDLYGEAGPTNRSMSFGPDLKEAVTHLGLMAAQVLSLRLANPNIIPKLGTYFPPPIEKMFP